jgi:hypothetical protein
MHDLSDAVKSLPGSVNFRPVSFVIKPGDSFSIMLEVKIDIQLEGDSAFRFGNPGALTPLFLHVPQWGLDLA